MSFTGRDDTDWRRRRLAHLLVRLAFPSPSFRMTESAFHAASGIAIIATLTPASPTILKWIPMAIWGFGQNHILNTSTVALMASVPHSDLAVVTGVMWVFRSTVRNLSLSTSLLAVLTPFYICRVKSPESLCLAPSSRTSSPAN